MAHPAGAQGYSAEEAVRHMKVADGLKVQLVASEPTIAQPVCIEFDDQRRLWVIQYLQYPNPAGLNRVKVDRFSRTVYDKIPEPPPYGTKGTDRITILSDFDENGRARKAKDFVTGLNLASGLAFGHGGVFVLQTPYLLFYPDKNGDDVPDSHPKVLLTGFGMEDAHSVANSLMFGPDGWLYGCQGSTVTANIRGIEFQQGIWRYHPISRRFELFCEGGGNSWGLDFDADGELIYSTNLSPFRNLHAVQGGYYWKSFGKHGALHNPYTYGYFDHIPYQNFTGGHVTDGGMIYQGTNLPEKFRGKYIANDLLNHSVQWHNIEPWGTTFKASYGGELLTPNDTWFAPSDLTTGPDGAVYVADWHDKRTAHPDPDADWDRSNGRVYRISAATSYASSQVMAEKELRIRETHSSKKLVELLESTNEWLVRKARQRLADRRDAKIVAPLQKMIFGSSDDHLALEYLWALYVSGGFENKLALKLLEHRSPQIRQWTVRFIGDEFSEPDVSAKTFQVPQKTSFDVRKPIARLIELSATEPDSRVRRQLASTAKRLPAKDGLLIAHNILKRNVDAQDAFIPLLLWWAIEHHSVTAIEDALKKFGSASAWESPMIRDMILNRLMKRYAAENTPRTFQACAHLLASAPTPNAREKMIIALDEGLPSTANRGANKTQSELMKQLEALWKNDCTNAALIRVMARLRNELAENRAMDLSGDSKSPVELRVTMLQLIAELAKPSAVDLLLRLSAVDQPEPVQLAALDALQQIPDAEIRGLFANYPKMSARVRGKARDVFFSRKNWAESFFHGVNAGLYAKDEVPLDQLQKIALLQDKRLDELVRKHWGNISGGTPEEKLADIRRFNNDLRAFAGDANRGHDVFTKTCAVCHRMFDEGENVGPDLTHANRDKDFLLTSIVDPSAVIRKEFINYIIETTDGRSLTGLVAEQSGNNITLVVAKNERTTISRDKIVSLRESAVSLMPEGLLHPLTPQERRDLFAYLQSEKPIASKK
jgi:putative membrane-bound dehydrogenase-like protein